MASTTNLEQLIEDIGTSALLAEVAYDGAIIESVVAAFEEEFRTAAIELRTTTKPLSSRGLSFRFVELERELDPYTRSVDAGLISPRGRPVDRLIPDLMERFDILGWGVDSEANYGVEKVWPFLAHAYPLSHVLDVPSIPPAVRANASFFERHRLTHFSIVAADYRHESANLYFMVPPPQARSIAQMDAMLDDLGMPALREMVSYASGGVALNVTVRWDSPDIQRICMYVPAPTADDVPVELDPLLATLTSRVPVQSEHRSFIPGATFARSGPYMKLEIDYTGTTLNALQRCVGVQPWVP